MNECLFCKIISNEVPNEPVYEDDEFISFMDINPLSPGHVLIIPKKHYRFVWDVKNVGQYFEITAKIARVIQKSFGTAEVHAKIVGEEVPHAHIWLYPNPEEAVGDKNDFKGNAEKIKNAL